MNLHPSTEYLSKTFNPNSPLNLCQNCSTKGSINAGSLLRHIEHDNHDRPTHTVILLCKPCSTRLIPPHPRLYSELHPNHPHPGAMQICQTCSLRRGTSCTHPAAKSNGGPGVSLLITKPFSAFIDGSKFSGRFTIYHDPASSCAQFIPIP